MTKDDSRTRQELIDENKRAVSEVVQQVEDVVGQVQPMPLGGEGDIERLREVADRLERLAETAGVSAQLARKSVASLEALRRREDSSGAGEEVPADNAPSTQQAGDGDATVDEDFNEATGRVSAKQRSRLKWGALVAVVLTLFGVTAFYLQQKAHQRENARDDATAQAESLANHRLSTANGVSIRIGSWNRYHSALEAEQWESAVDEITTLQKAGVEQIPKENYARTKRAEQLVNATSDNLAELSDDSSAKPATRKERATSALKRLETARDLLDASGGDENLMSELNDATELADGIRAEAGIDEAEDLAEAGDDLLDEHRFAQGRQKYEKALAKLSELPTPDSHAESMSDLEADISDNLESVQETADRYYERKLRRIRENSVEVESAEIEIIRIRTTSRWTFDRYGSRYKYRAADKNREWVQIDFKVSSPSKNPALPGFVVYALDADGPSSLGIADVEFYRWSDYGAYLGNYHDNRNDFAKRDTVYFSAAVSVGEQQADEPMLVGLTDSGCFYRNTSRFDQPPVSYQSGGCTYPTYPEVPKLLEKIVPVRTLNGRGLDLQDVSY